jgi:nitrite reductase (NADH) small subunit
VSTDTIENAVAVAASSPAAQLATKPIEQMKKVCPLTEIPRLGARVVRSSVHGNIAVFRNADDEVFALEDKCPHKGGPLSQGIVHGKRVACPLHNWNIELTDGCAVAPDHGCAKAFPVQVKDGTVYLEV